MLALDGIALYIAFAIGILLFALNVIFIIEVPSMLNRIAEALEARPNGSVDDRVARLEAEVATLDEANARLAEYIGSQNAHQGPQNRF